MMLSHSSQTDLHSILLIRFHSSAFRLQCSKQARAVVDKWGEQLPYPTSTPGMFLKCEDVAQCRHVQILWKSLSHEDYARSGKL